MSKTGSYTVSILPVGERFPTMDGRFHRYLYICHYHDYVGEDYCDCGTKKIAFKDKWVLIFCVFSTLLWARGAARFANKAGAVTLNHCYYDPIRQGEDSLHIYL